MKPGSRALGVAESFGRDRDRSTLAGVLTRADRVVDGFAFSTATVGGTDATDAVVDLFERLDREDVRFVLVGGVALSWYNVVDVDAVATRVDRPTIAVTFEESDGLAGPLREAFDGQALRRRLSAYGDLPERRPVDVGEETVFVRSAGVEPDRADEVVRRFTPGGGRPEPLRLARLLARAGDEFRTPGDPGTGTDNGRRREP